MFDNVDFENSKLIKNKSGNDFFADKPVSEINSQKSELDSEVAQELQARLMGFYRQELDRQAQNRYEMAIDEDYYDNIQWDDESAAILRQRGQAPLVYNVISTSVRWVLGDSPVLKIHKSSRGIPSTAGHGKSRRNLARPWAKAK